MNTAVSSFPIQREPELLGQTVVVIGGSSGIGPDGRDVRHRRRPAACHLLTQANRGHFFLQEGFTYVQNGRRFGQTDVVHDQEPERREAKMMVARLNV
jgi:hypothetical protein